MILKNGKSVALLFTIQMILSSSWASAANSDGEEIPAEEAAAIREVSDLIAGQVKAEAAKSGHAFRDAHRKQHGCVRALFSVDPSVPARIKKGLFAQPATYSSWIRFSNGSGQAQDDHDGDGRGMAIKILGVKGSRNLHDSDDETSSQDFLMINHPVFFVRNAADYVDFQKAISGGSILWWFLKHAFHEGRIAKAIQGKVMVNPFDSEYFSMTASKLGNTQMKFRTIPCANSKFVNSSDSVNRLGENLKATLQESDSCFLFQVQERLNVGSMSVEDPSEEWSEDESPFVTVGRLSIPSQVPLMGEQCEAMSFNPWNGLADHRPLGGISRARKEVYQTVSRLRHDFNKQRRDEPGK